MKPREETTDIGRKIYNARKEKGYTLEDVGNKLGLSKATVSRYETGIIENLSFDKIPALCNVLGITPNELFGWQEKPNKRNPEKEKLEESLLVAIGYVSHIIKRIESLADKE